MRITYIICYPVLRFTCTHIARACEKWKKKKERKRKRQHFRIHQQKLATVFFLHHLISSHAVLFSLHAFFAFWGTFATMMIMLIRFHGDACVFKKTNENDGEMDVMEKGRGEAWVEEDLSAPWIECNNHGNKYKAIEYDVGHKRYSHTQYTNTHWIYSVHAHIKFIDTWPRHRGEREWRWRRKDHHKNEEKWIILFSSRTKGINTHTQTHKSSENW